MGFLARTESIGPSRCCLSTSRYRNSRAQRAWLWVDADNVPIHGQMGEEGLDFRKAHLAWVTLAVEQDKTPDPTDIGFLGARRIVLDADGVTYQVEQSLGALAHLRSSLLRLPTNGCWCILAGAWVKSKRLSVECAGHRKEQVFCQSSIVPPFSGLASTGFMCSEVVMYYAQPGWLGDEFLA